MFALNEHDISNVVDETFALLIDTYPVTVILSDDIDKSLLDVLQSLGTINGNNAILPLFVARILIKYGVAEYQAEYTKNIPLALRYFMRERDTVPIQKLPESFFILLIEKLKQIKEENRTTPTPEKLLDERRLEEFIRDLLSIRLNKIMKLARMNESEEISEKLTIEERWLHKKLAELYKAWLKTLNIDL